MSRRAALIRTLLACAVALLAAASPSAAKGRLDGMPSGMQVGLFSPANQAARDRAVAPYGLRYLYLTGGVGSGDRWAPGTEGGDGTAEWLRESFRAGMVPVLTYYQLQPSAPPGNDERTAVSRVLRDASTMRAYWRDVRAALMLMGADRSHLVVFQVEPDAWEYVEQLQGVRTPAVVGSSGMAELRGLRDDARGYARAFVRLRNRYAPNVALAWHLSAWGMGQVNPASVENSQQIGAMRASFLHRLGARFDLVTHDPGGSGFDDASFAEHLALLRTFHDATHLPILLWQIPADNRVPWLLGPDPAARAHLAAERSAGVVGMLFDGTPGAHAAGAPLIGRYVAAGYASGALGR